LESVIILYIYKRFHQFFNYTLIGVGATLTHFACLYLLVDILHLLDPVVATIIAFLCGASVSFVFNSKFVFKLAQPNFTSLGRYLLLTGFSGLNNTMLMFILVKTFNWHYMLAQLFTTGAIFILNFTICKFWIFKSKEQIYVN